MIIGLALRMNRTPHEIETGLLASDFEDIVEFLKMESERDSGKS
jgi:hypothetical protein